MNLAYASVHRPVFTTMITLMVVVLGTMALSRLQFSGYLRKSRAIRRLLLRCWGLIESRCGVSWRNMSY